MLVSLSAIQRGSKQSSLKLKTVSVWFLFPEKGYGPSFANKKLDTVKQR